MAPRITGKKTATAKKRPEANKALQQFYECPKGHRLPHRTDSGNCTALYCAGYAPQKRLPKEEGAKKRKAVRKTTAAEAVVTSALAKSDASELASVEDEKIERAAVRHNARMKYLKVPENLQGADAEEWADRKFVELLPVAAAKLEFNLKYGDEEQQERAAKQVLDATGRGKRDAGGAGSAPIIMLVNPGGGPVQVPWAQRVEPVAKITSGEKK